MWRSPDPSSERSPCLLLKPCEPLGLFALQGSVARYVLSGGGRRRLCQGSSCLQTVSVLVTGETSAELGQRKQVYPLGLELQGCLKEKSHSAAVNEERLKGEKNGREGQLALPTTLE